MLMGMTSVMIFCAVEKRTSAETMIADIGIIGAAPVADSDPGENYAKYCASCHGSDARAFADRRSWVHGDDKASIAKVIVEGLTNDGMPAFEETFTAKEVDELATYIVNAKVYVDQYVFEEAFDASQTFTYNNHDYQLSLVTDDVDIPWGMAMAADGTLIYTDKRGVLRKRSEDGTVTVISGLPAIWYRRQGGLLDILLAKDFVESNVIYLSYSKPNPDNNEEGTTAVYKARLEGNTLVEGADIWVAKPYYPTFFHFGSRLIWDNDGYLYVSIGDRGKRDINPQDLSLYPGKIHRINADGSIPEDNPYVGQVGAAVASIWSYGHRNPQGLAYDADANIIYENEHGPRGGDEINIITSGINYGWPVISYGINYSGTTFTDKTEQEGMAQPEHFWVPAIGVCGMAYVSSDLYPDWKGHLLSGSLKYEYLNLNRIDGDNMSSEEKLFPNIGRLRSIVQGADGYLYIGVEEPGRIYRIMPL